MRVSAWCSRSWLCVIAGAVAVATLAAVGLDARTDEHVVLRATAGVAGFVKAGRWAAVQVHVDQRHDRNPAVTGDLLVRWGDATVRRRVRLGHAGSERYEIYVRTSDPASTIVVSLDGHARAIEVPVTVLPHDAPVVLCIGADDRPSEIDASCSVMAAARELAASVRGYEAVDAVVHDAALRTNARQAAALVEWRVLRALDHAGDLSLTPQVSRPRVERGLARSLASPVATIFVVYAGLLIVAGVAAARRHAGLLPIGLTVCALAVTASGLAFEVGHVGPGSAITVHHTSLVQQLPGTSAALVSMRGLAEYPSNEHAQLRLPVDDAMIEASTASGRSEQLMDETGRPVLALAVGMGGRRSFVAEGMASSTWLDVESDHRRVRVVNRTPHVLRGCSFAAGMSVEQVGDLASGAGVVAEHRGDVLGPVFTCTTDAAALALGSPDRHVVMIGTTTVAVYLPRPAEPSLPGTLND